MYTSIRSPTFLVSWPATGVQGSWSNVPQSLWPLLPWWNQEKLYSPTANTWGEHYGRIVEDAWRCYIWLWELVVSHPFCKAIEVSYTYRGHIPKYASITPGMIQIHQDLHWNRRKNTGLDKAQRQGFSPIAKPHLPPWPRGSKPESCGSIMAPCLGNAHTHKHELYI